MDAYAHMLQPGDTATAVLTGEFTHMSRLTGGPGLAYLALPGNSAYAQVLLPEQPGIRLIAGDLTPTLLQALEDAIEHLGAATQDRDPEWVAPETLDRLDRYERALDALRGEFIDDEKLAGDCL